VRQLRHATASPVLYSTTLSRHATRMLSTVAAVPQIEPLVPMSVWTVACVCRLRAITWVPYGNLDVQIRPAKPPSVRRSVLEVCKPHNQSLTNDERHTDEPAVNNDFDGHNPVPAWNIQTCDFGTYCCRAINDKSSCCNNSTAPTFKSSTLGSWDFKAAAIAAVGSSIVSSDDSSSISTPSASSSTASPSPKETQATLITNADVCESEKQKTVIVGGVLGGILGAVVIGLLGVIFWMAKREQRQRKLKEHYEEQFAQTWAYRKHIAASTASVKDEKLDRVDSHAEILDKSSGS
jgi:hypothetical protein